LHEREARVILYLENLISTHLKEEKAVD